MQNFLQPHLAGYYGFFFLFLQEQIKGIIIRRGRAARMGTSKPSVVDTKVSQSAGSKASLADVGLMVPSHERGFQKSSRALELSACSSNPFISTRRVESAARLCPCASEGGEAGAAPRSACQRSADAGP